MYICVCTYVVCRCLCWIASQAWWMPFEWSTPTPATTTHLNGWRLYWWRWPTRWSPPVEPTSQTAGITRCGNRTGRPCWGSWRTAGCSTGSTSCATRGPRPKWLTVQTKGLLTSLKCTYLGSLTLSAPGEPWSGQAGHCVEWVSMAYVRTYVRTYIHSSMLLYDSYVHMATYVRTSICDRFALCMYCTYVHMCLHNYVCMYVCMHVSNSTVVLSM